MRGIPVNHRPRAFGGSKYGIHDRVWAGILDTLAVGWLQKRAVRAGIRTGSHEEKPELTASQCEWLPPGRNVGMKRYDSLGRIRRGYWLVGGMGPR